MRLEFRMKLVLAGFFLTIIRFMNYDCQTAYRFISLEKYNSAAFVTRCKVVTGMVELNRRDNIRYNPDLAIEQRRCALHLMSKTDLL